MALEYAQKGYEITVKEKLEMIKDGNIIASNGWELRTNYYSEGKQTQ